MARPPEEIVKEQEGDIAELEATIQRVLDLCADPQRFHDPWDASIVFAALEGAETNG